MAPALSVNDEVDGTPGYIELFRQANMDMPGCSQFPNLQNLMLLQFGSVVFFSCLHPGTIESPALSIAILHVILFGSEKQMGWPETWRIIAMMANIKANRNGSPQREFHRETVDRFEFSMQKCISVAARNPRARPFQASVALRHGLRNHFLNKFVAGNLVSHVRGLLSRACMALAALKRCGAFSILAQGAY